ncbi:MAG: TRASH domain-containing protein [Planctomycetaceae bacterium]|nr:TRASH domain-containing protein [Planctomycetaceae bacterium]
MYGITVRRLCAILCCLIGLGVGLSWAEMPTGEEAVARTALETFNSIIGGWRGVGQPRRGSSKGAWSEQAEFKWDFANKTPSIVYAVEKGQLTEQATVVFDPQSQQYVMTWTQPDATKHTLQGAWDKNQLVLTSSADSFPQQRVTITLLNDKRTLVLFEQRSTETTAFSRTAEVGYTRAGTRLARPGGGQPECVVTGGAGTIPVTHKGKTYYVCCSGCKQAFEDDPEGILAEYEAKLRKVREGQQGS